MSPAFPSSCCGILSLLLFLLSACAPVTMEYRDPLQELGGGAVTGAAMATPAPAPPARYPNLTLGVRTSENALRALALVRKESEFLGSFGNGSAMRDLDASGLLKGINAALGATFQSVIRLDEGEDAQARGANLTMLLDLRVEIGQVSGQATTVEVKGIFADPAGNVLGVVQSQGQGRVPEPAFLVGFQQAASQAAQGFSSGLRSSPQLQAALDRLPGAALAAAPAPALAAAATTPAAALAGPATGRRTALVIGNGAYPTAPLRNTVNDASDVAAALRRLGFDVILRTNAGLRDMDAALEDFHNRLKRGGTGLFYFSGHGVQVAGSNYLVPLDARINSESDVRYQALDAGRVLGKMEDAGNDLNLVILDACRNNPFGKGFRSANRGLAPMDAPTGSLIAYATAPGSVAADGKGRNGTYTKYLLQNLETPGLPITDLFMRVRMGVVDETGKAQVPWESSSLTGYFYFRPPAQ